MRPTETVIETVILPLGAPTQTSTTIRSKPAEVRWMEVEARGEVRWMEAAMDAGRTWGCRSPSDSSTVAGKVRGWAGPGEWAQRVSVNLKEAQDTIANLEQRALMHTGMGGTGGTGAGETSPGQRAGEQKPKMQQSAAGGLGSGGLTVGGGLTGGLVGGGGLTGAGGGLTGAGGGLTGGVTSSAVHGGVSPRSPTCSANWPIQLPDGWYWHTT